MSPEAEAVHGISDAFLADKPKFADIVEGFWNLSAATRWSFTTRLLI